MTNYSTQKIFQLNHLLKKIIDAKIPNKNIFLNKLLILLQVTILDKNHSKKSFGTISIIDCKCANGLKYIRLLTYDLILLKEKTIIINEIFNLSAPVYNTSK